MSTRLIQRAMRTLRSRMRRMKAHTPSIIVMQEAWQPRLVDRHLLIPDQARRKAQQYALFEYLFVSRLEAARAEATQMVRAVVAGQKDGFGEAALAELLARRFLLDIEPGG